MKIYRMAILILLLLAPAIAVSPVLALNADSMWIQPPDINYTSSTPVGTKFNVTVWLNVTSLTNSWQFYMTYNRAQLNNTNSGLTGNGKSLWAGALPTDNPSPSSGVHNATHDYLLWGEVLKTNAEKTGEGTLAWVEFQIMQAPSQGQTLTSDIRLDIEGVFSSTAMDKLFTPITLTYGKTTYIIPEFPITALLFAALMITAAVALVLRKRISQTPRF